MNPIRLLGLALVLFGLVPFGFAAERLRVFIETDAGGDPDDEQSLVRFLLYVNEWDVEGIIANRPHARDGENLNSERTGLGIVRRQLNAYGQCWTNLVQHDPRYPTRDALWERTVPGYNHTNAGIEHLIAVVDRPDPRPVWYSDWGTDEGAATNNLKRTLDYILKQRGPEGYARFKSKLRITAHDKFGDHTTRIAPPFALWVNTFEPALNGRRWYHRFSGITARAGGFDLYRDVLTGHGPLGELYPTNTTHWQKEGDTPTFLYFMPTGMNDPNQPTWGSWAGRYGPHEKFPGKPYYWANQTDVWNGSTNRDNTLARWAVHLQNDFRARLDWCVRTRKEANHPPRVMVNGHQEEVLTISAKAGSGVQLDATKSVDPDGNALKFEWLAHPEAGTYPGKVGMEKANEPRSNLRVPADAGGRSIHVVVSVTDSGEPALTRYGRVVVQVSSQ